MPAQVIWQYRAIFGSWSLALSSVNLHGQQRVYALGDEFTPNVPALGDAGLSFGFPSPLFAKRSAKKITGKTSQKDVFLFLFSRTKKVIWYLRLPKF